MKQFFLLIGICLILEINAQNSGKVKRTLPGSSPTPTSGTSAPKNSSTKPSTSSSPSREKIVIDPNKTMADLPKPAFFSPLSPMSIMSTVLEIGGYPTDADISYINVYGHLGLNFDIARAAFVGPYMRHKLASTSDFQVVKIDDKNVNVNSYREWGAGISTGLYLKLGTKILIIPELRLGYNEYSFQDTSYTEANKKFINHIYLSASPRFSIGIKMSDYSIFGLNGGYNFPFYMNGDVTGAYNPGTFTYGVHLKFYLPTF